MENTEDIKSPMEIAMEFIAANPSLTGILGDDAFQALFQYPEEIIKHHQSVIDNLVMCHGFTQEMIDEYCKDYLAESCQYVSDLKAIIDENRPK